MSRLGQFWKYVWEGVDGLKTVGVAVVFILLGLADYLDAVNVRPVLDQAFGEDKGAKIMMFLPIVFGTLRFLTSDKMRWLRKREDEKVDELNQKEEH